MLSIHKRWWLWNWKNIYCTGWDERKYCTSASLVCNDTTGNPKPEVITKVVVIVKNVFLWYNLVPQKFQSCLIWFLPSAVYYTAWLKTTHPTHPVLDKYLFTEDGIFEELQWYFGDVHISNYFNLVRKGVSYLDRVSYYYFFQMVLIL